MNKTIKLQTPSINEWIYAEDYSVGQKQDGLKNDAKKFHIGELSQEEAENYAEEYKKAFLEKYLTTKK
ncbi:MULTISPECIES: hypothetical protein [unclassified Chryseobacterium]|uniref:hypothetical protein n=1 Tax=unclassified Chryseobacterium TaxID=2593645 RepID=UPI0028536099|nr:hypothetical protein [Chryseobacterium sp. CFS7]MDR4892265.1 hypothetical protein [Chryseobacterium sp. CFS7]